MQNLDFRVRKEIGKEVWRVFALHSHNISIAFDEDGVTIRVQFDEPFDLGGPDFIAGQTSGLNDYTEVPVGWCGPRS